MMIKTLFLAAVASTPLLVAGDNTPAAVGPGRVLLEDFVHENRKLYQEDECKYHDEYMIGVTDAAMVKLGAVDVKHYVCNSITSLFTHAAVSDPFGTFAGPYGACIGKAFLAALELSEKVGKPLLDDDGNIIVANCEALFDALKSALDSTSGSGRKLFFTNALNHLGVRDEGALNAAMAADKFGGVVLEKAGGFFDDAKDFFGGLF